MDKVREWLESIGLGQYGDAFSEDGWDDMNTVLTMKESDIKDVVKKPGHARKIFMSLKNRIHDKKESDSAASTRIPSHLEIAEVQNDDLNVNKHDSAKKYILEMHTRTRRSSVESYNQNIALVEESNCDDFIAARQTKMES